MLCRAQVAVARMHKHLLHLQHEMLLPRPAHAVMTRSIGLPVRATRAFHEPERQPTDLHAPTPHAGGTRAEEGALDHSTQQPQPPQRTLTVLEAREQMRHAMEPEAHRIAGVTFEGRQEAVQKLQAGGTIILAFQPQEGALLCVSMPTPFPDVITGKKYSTLSALSEELM